MDITVCIGPLEVRATGGDPAIPQDRYAVMEVQASTPLLASAGYRQFGRMVGSYEYRVHKGLPVGYELLYFLFGLIRPDHVNGYLGSAAAFESRQRLKGDINDNPARVQE